jgi:hypothetical protein
MTEFYKTISASEVKTTYINLTDNQNETYGIHFPPAGTKLCILDEVGQEFNATKHGNNQLWSKIRQWFISKNIQAGTFVKISYNPTEFRNGKPVVHIEIQNQQTVPPLQSTINLESESNESEYSTAEISFEFEKQLENFLKDNLEAIERKLKVYVDEEDNYGQQYVTDVGIIDLLCTDKNGNFVVIELKKKRTSDIVVGQVLRYMGWVNQNLNSNKKVRGLIITPEIDNKLEYAASMVPDIQVKYFRVKLEFVTKDDIENK